MEFIQSIIALDWTELSVQLLAVYGGLKGLAALTPWNGDDKIVNSIGNAVKKVLAIFGK